ncbi:hypothetical protein QYE76_048060 [Lolium multiflorum]|uniref:Transposase (putative) gypsy type domain-containing protein n=1 Tax=Lolium multiflorum TaxID=4521 RepID=A0AAD8WZV7_LOLMU|nr:hypothetical protein QYE76_048060 [Lolium multiflorum]
MATEDLEWERSKISNQDMNLLKKLGFAKKKDALRFPHEESYPSPPMEYRLHQLMPNSILHVSIFIILCECFLGVQPNWALWKRIFCLRRNGSHGVAYNIGGVVICSLDVDYFDVKFLIPSKCGARGGEVEERAVVTDDNQGTSRPESGVGGSQKFAASLEKENETEVTSSTRSSLPAASPKGKRKRDEIIDSGASKADTSRAEKTAPDAEEKPLDLYDASLISS